MNLRFSGTTFMNEGYVPARQVKAVLDRQPDLRPSRAGMFVSAVDTGRGETDIDRQLRQIAEQTADHFSMPLSAIYAYSEKPLDEIDFAEKQELLNPFQRDFC
jgi:hypothetical protein